MPKIKYTARKVGGGDTKTVGAMGTGVVSVTGGSREGNREESGDVVSGDYGALSTEAFGEIEGVIDAEVTGAPDTDDPIPGTSMGLSGTMEVPEVELSLIHI